MLADMDGFDVVRRLRGGGARIPVVFLTARDATEDKIRGLTPGGDDYVTKPFSLEEVIARIRAVLRRTRGEGIEPSPRLKFADLELDEDSHEVWRAGKSVQLSPTEFKLLRYFMGNANRVLSKMQILDHVWDYDFRGDTDGSLHPVSQTTGQIAVRHCLFDGGSACDVPTPSGLAVYWLPQHGPMIPVLVPASPYQVSRGRVPPPAVAQAANWLLHHPL